MDNLKYYNDSFAYDYDIFAPDPKKKAEIHKYPENKKSKAKKGINKTARNLVISGMVVISVCFSLFLRAEISSLERDINKINKEIVELQSESTRLSVEMERKVSVINLEAAAKELGMQKCEKSQVTYIQTQTVDSAETSDGELTVDLNN